MMKLKGMYTCVTSKRECDSPYETADSKSYQTKKLNKASKRNAFRCKLLSLNSLKATTETPPKSPRKIEPPPSLTSMNIMEIEKQSEINKDKKMFNDVFTNNNLPAGRTKAKTNSISSLKTGSSNRRQDSPKVETRKIGQRHNTVTGVIEKELTEKSLHLNSLVFDDLSSSRDDVFTVPTPTSSWIIGNKAWDEKDVSNSGNLNETSLKKTQAFKFKKSSRQTTNSTENLLSMSRDDSFEDLINQRCKRESDGRIGSLSSISSLSSTSLARTSVDRASESFDTIRALCEKERLQHYHTFKQRNLSTASVPAIPKRAFSASPTIREVDWSDIPPLVPPREPVRQAKLSIPQRHASSPSTTSTTRRSPVATKLTNSFSSSTSLENQRRKFKSPSSTTAVFSAVPDSQRKPSPIILPIMKDGKQESHTHYFLLGEEEDPEKTRKPERIKPDPMHAIPRPTSKSRLMSLNCVPGTPPPRPPPTSSYHSQRALRDDRERTNSLPLPSETTPKSTFTYPHPKSPSLNGSTEKVVEKSRSSPRCSAMSPGQMISALQSQVFGVTTEECQLALRKNDWSVSKSINYLKVEQLFRTGFVSRENCHQILEKTGWDLQSASLLLLEHHQQKLKSRS